MPGGRAGQREGAPKQSVEGGPEVEHGGASQPGMVRGVLQPKAGLQQA